MRCKMNLMCLLSFGMYKHSYNYLAAFIVSYTGEAIVESGLTLG
jgi:hypothetical protein